MRTLASLVVVILANICVSQDEAETYLKVEQARAKVPSCQKLLKESKATGSIPMLLKTYSEIDEHAEKLSDCMFVFRITGDVARADEAGDEGDRWDAVGAMQMKRYLQAKRLWEDFLRQDCRQGSTNCGAK